MTRRFLAYAAVAAMGVALAVVLQGVTQPAIARDPGDAGYSSPLFLAVSPDGETLYVTENTGDGVAIARPGEPAPDRVIPVGGSPAGIAVSPDGGTLYVAQSEGTAVTVIDAGTYRTAGEIQVGLRPWGLDLSSDGSTLYVCNQFSNDVSVVDTASGEETARVPVVREPSVCALSEPQSTLVVGNRLAYGSNHDPDLAAEVSFIDTDTMEMVESFRLPSGCNDIEGVCVSPDGRWAYVVHLLSRFLVPTTQLERGWMNTNALSIIDLTDRSLLATVLLDDLDRGAANPFDCVIAPDGETLYVSLRGTHQIVVVDVPGLHRIIEETPVEERPDLANDLTFLYRNGVKERIDCGGIGPRGLALTPDGDTLFVANWFSGDVSTLRTRDMELRQVVDLGDPEEMDELRRGELYFYDATLCFQHWQSCASCHPDTRADALMWDLLNDGIGNPKNAKSLVMSHATPPSMSSGVRSDWRVASEAGYKYILFREPQGTEVDDVAAYLASIEPEPGAILLLDDPEVMAQIERGRELFEDPSVGCAECHPGPLYTDLQTHDVGTRSQYDRRDDFDTPTLLEIWRTGPYLHDGTAVTVEDVLTVRNEGDEHGTTSHLSPEEIDDLATYLKSL